MKGARKLMGQLSLPAAAAFFLTMMPGLGRGAPPQTAAEIYAHKCAVCHAKDGSAATAKGKQYKVKDVRVQVKKYSEAEMIKVVQQGKGANMDSFSDDLNDAQIKAVVEYYRGLATAKK